LSFLSVAIAVYISLLIVDLPDEFELVFKQVQLTLMNIIVFWVVFRAIDPVSQLVAHTSTGTVGNESRELAVKVVQVGVIVLGFLSILQAWGINVSAFLAGLGLLGMAVALAAQDTMKNFFGSIVIIADEIFKKGDWIKTPQVEGIVEEFGLRTTVVRGFDDAQIHVPNATLADTTIVNFSRCRIRQICMTLPLGGDSTAVQLRKVKSSYKEFLQSNKRVCQDKVIIVNLDCFGENCVQLFVFCFTPETAWAPFLEVKQEILFHFKKLAEEAHVSFGVPTRAVTVQKIRN